jgi:hypothetical protein
MFLGACFQDMLLLSVPNCPAPGPVFVCLSVACPVPGPGPVFCPSEDRSPEDPLRSSLEPRRSDESYPSTLVDTHRDNQPLYPNTRGCYVLSLLLYPADRYETSGQTLLGFPSPQPLFSNPAPCLISRRSSRPTLVHLLDRIHKPL